VANRGDVVVVKRPLGLGRGALPERYAVVQSDALNSVLDVTLVVPVEVATKANSGTPLAVPVSSAEAGTQVACVALANAIMLMRWDDFAAGVVGQLDAKTLTSIGTVLKYSLDLP